MKVNTTVRESDYFNKLKGENEGLRSDYKQSQYHLSQAEQRLQEAKAYTVHLQAQLISVNDQLIEAQEKLLNPVIEVRPATSDIIFDLQVTANKYEKIVTAFQRYSVEPPGYKATARTELVDKLRAIIGDDVNVQKVVTEGEVKPC